MVPRYHDQGHSCKWLECGVFGWIGSVPGYDCLGYTYMRLARWPICWGCPVSGLDYLGYTCMWLGHGAVCRSRFMSGCKHHDYTCIWLARWPTGWGYSVSECKHLNCTCISVECGALAEVASCRIESSGLFLHVTLESHTRHRQDACILTGRHCNDDCACESNWSIVLRDTVDKNWSWHPQRHFPFFLEAERQLTNIDEDICSCAAATSVRNWWTHICSSSWMRGMASDYRSGRRLVCTCSCKNASRGNTGVTNRTRSKNI